MRKSENTIFHVHFSSPTAMGTAQRCVLFLAFSLAFAATAENSGPIAWWKMEAIENGKIHDASGNGRDLTVAAGVTTTNGLNGNGIWYDGTANAYSTFSCPAMTSRTVCVCFYPPSGSRPWVAGQSPYPYLLDGISSFQALYVTNQPSWTEYLGNGAGYRWIPLSNATFTWNQWNHMVWSIDMAPTENANVYSAIFSYYLNGNLQGTSASLLVTNPAVASIGWLGNGASKLRPVYGTVDDARVYDRTLSPEEILQQWQELNGWDKPSLVGSWTMDATTGTNGVRIVADQSGNGRDLVLGEDNFLTNGVDESALSFAGTLNSYAMLTNLPAFASWTLSGWVRQSSLSSTPIVTGNFYPRIMEGANILLHLSYNAYDLDATFKNYSDNSSQGFSQIMIKKDAWSHFAVVSRILYSAESNTLQSTSTYYVNGKKVGTGKPVAITKTFQNAGQTVYFGNTNFKQRPLLGELDDLAFFSGALSDDEVETVYRGLPSFTAGNDFTCAAATAALQGFLEKGNTNFLREGYSGGAFWSLVSAPEGGGNAAILSPEDPQTLVNLPVVGTYVFRLTVTNLLAHASDEVSVTRIAAASENVPPTVRLVQAAVCTNPAPLTLAATVQDADNGPGTLRVNWSKRSGPGGVYFSSPFSATTAASFTAPGTYLLQCKADDGQSSSAASISLTVYDAADSLTNGLSHYWPMNRAKPLVDTVANATLNPANGAVYADGISGYGLQMRDAKSYLTSTAAPPNADFTTVSLWLYQDSSNTNKTTYTRVLMHDSMQIQYNLDGKLYLRMFGKDGQDFVWEFQKIAQKPVDCWFHIAACFDRRATDNPRDKQKLYYNGQLLPVTALITNESYAIPVNGAQPYFAGTRYSSSAKYIFGGNGQQGGAPYISRMFPGTLDEIRTYDRQITDAEAAVLASASLVKQENLAPQPEVPLATVKGTLKKAFALKGKVYDDGLPEGNTVTCQWKLVSGDASGISITGADSETCSILPTKVGTYLFQLEACDGDRKGFSSPVEVKIFNPGTIIKLM